ncbi:hypothetical protein POD19_00160 [Micrococcus sp. GPGPB33]|uniref:hypothetical protein n=1 Tax=Micrococcus sp. GPGPB33 TaxID=3023084 RepID=UPI0030C0C6C6
MSTAERSSYYYSNEVDGQLDFFREFKIDPDISLVQNTDGVHRGNLLEFKVSIGDVNKVLFQAIKYLSRLRVRGHNVPANILLVDLNKQTIFKFDSADYFAEIHQIYTTSASRAVQGFQAKSNPVVIKDYFGAGAGQVAALLKENDFVPIEITEDCVVAWAERYYREVPGSNKESFLANDPRKGPLGELKAPKHFDGLILPYKGDDYEAFAHILDRLNDKLKKIELGAFYTPQPYVQKSHELLREAIARVPAGNDYVIVDRCAGSGNLIEGLSDEELSHVIVNTYEQFEYLELAREYGDRVRAVIPPTYKAGDPALGVLLNGDALSDRFVLGLMAADGSRVPNEIHKHVADPNCTVILFENPPYADAAGVESNVSGKKKAFGWQASWVKAQMAAEPAISRNGTKPLRDLTNLFIWSAFKYYLRQPTDSYVVYSPSKYFKSQGLINRKFIDGFLFNRKRFHATKDAGVSCILWANEPETGRTVYPLRAFDIDPKTDQLVPGAVHKDFQVGVGNVRAGADGLPVVDVKTTSSVLSKLFDTRKFPDDETGIYCETNGRESDESRKAISTAVYNDNILGYLRAYGNSFENIDLYSQLTRCTAYNGNGFHLRRDNYLTKLPLFAMARIPSEGRYWIRGVVNRNADNGDNFSHDQDFLKACLIFTGLAYHNKCRSFTGSDGREYRNELCFDAGTQASRDLAGMKLTAQEQVLMTQWGRVLDLARQTTNYDPQKTYGTFQIEEELNTFYYELVGQKRIKVYDYPVLNGEVKAMRKQTMEYHAAAVAPFLWKYELLK